MSLFSVVYVVVCLLFVGVNSRAIEASLLSDKNKVNLRARQSCSAQNLLIHTYDTNSLTNLLGGDSSVDGTGAYTVTGGVGKWSPTISQSTTAYWYTDMYDESVASGSQCTNLQSKFGADATLFVTLGKTTSAAAKITVGVNIGCTSSVKLVSLGYASLGTGTVSSVFSFKIAPALTTASDLQKIAAVVFLAESGNVASGAAITIDNLFIGCGSSTSTASSTTTASKSTTTTSPASTKTSITTSTTISSSKTSTTTTSTASRTSLKTTASSTTLTSAKTSTTTSLSTTTASKSSTTTLPSTTTTSTSKSSTTTSKTTATVVPTTTPPPTVQGASVYNWCGTQKLVALGFDGGTSLQNIQLLADLKKYGIKATYFISGPFDQYDCDTIKDIVAQGHAIENHSWNHLDSLTLTDAQLKSEITRVQDFITNTCKMNYKFTQFRPPFGSLDFATVKKINQMGYTVASWTYDTNDYESGMTLNKIFNRVVSLQSKLPSNTSTSILHHDDQYRTGVDIGILEKYLDYFKGYKFVTAAECFQACLQEGKCVSPINEWPGVFIDTNYGEPPIHTN